MSMTDPRSLHKLIPYGEALTPVQTRLFVTIVAMAQAREPITIRGLMRRLGVRSPNSVFPNLKNLRKRGLIAWEGEGRWKTASATIRPLMRLELFAECWPELARKPQAKPA